MRSFRKILGAIILDVPRYCWHLGPQNVIRHSWVKVRNRHDHLLITNNPVGVNVDQKWSSNLYLPMIFPIFGKILFKKATDSHPIKFEPTYTLKHKQPDVTFIIGHRGSARTPLLLKTLSSIAAQRGCHIECIVVEQDNSSCLEAKLPAWVNHVFSPLLDAEMPYSRSKAFNVGAEHANAECLIFHDNDMLVSQDYALQILDKVNAGYNFVNLKRFIFYLSKSTSKRMLDSNEKNTKLAFDSIVQNLEGGGSIGTSKKSFFSIGRFDERFIGWGGEDNEFWERALTQKVWSFTYLPLIHLWHEFQTEKLDIEASDTKALYNELTRQAPKDRIRALLAEQPREAPLCVD